MSFLGLDTAASADTSGLLTHNSQTIPLPEASAVPDQAAQDSANIAVDDNALLADAGPLGTSADMSAGDLPSADAISLYVVRQGDTLPVIAKMFSVSVNTIRWANDLSSSASVHEGDTLVILPISGLDYTIKKGDTLPSIAKKYKADADEIGKFNGLEADSQLVIGSTIIIPDGELAAIIPKYSGGSTGTTKNNRELPRVAFGPTRLKPGTNDVPDFEGYYIRPVSGGECTQGLHGWNAVDIGDAAGSPIYAAAAGTVIIARDSGWNGGYGKYVAISHPNGTQTVYGHMSHVAVSSGESVSQGEVIGAVGMTGEATGNHVHFEVRGGKNPFCTNM